MFRHETALASGKLTRGSPGGQPTYRKSLCLGVQQTKAMREERTAMKIVILGAGALGSLLGAQLAQGGADVILLARGPRAQWVQEHGLTVTGLVTCTVPVHVVVHPQEVQDAEVL